MTAAGKLIERSMRWNCPRPSWSWPDDVALVPQLAPAGGYFVLPLGSTNVAKLVAA